MMRLIQKTAREILEQSPGAVVRYRLLRDVLDLPRGDAALTRART